MKNILLSFFISLIVFNAIAQNVGIGTSSPAFKLDVGGRMRIKTGTIGNVSTSSGMWLEDYRDGTNRIFFGMQDSMRSGFYGAGTGGVGWAFNFNAKTGDVGITDGVLGIGTISPAYDIYINRTQPTIGFNDIAKNHFSGTIQGDSTNLLINAYRKSSVGANASGDLILQVNSGVFPTGVIAGNVGIGTNAPEEKLHISGNLKLQGSSSQIILTNSSLTDKGRIFLSGNDLKIGTASGNASGRVVISTNNTDQIAVTSAGELNRLTQTGTADLLPIVYGKISSSGSVLNTTGNFTVSKSIIGIYKITLTNESNLYQNRDNYVLIVTAAVNFFLVPVMINASIVSDNTIEIRTTTPKVFFSNSSCSQTCGPYSLINSTQIYEQVDIEFNILIYKH